MAQLIRSDPQVVYLETLSKLFDPNRRLHVESHTIFFCLHLNRDFCQVFDDQ